MTGVLNTCINYNNQHKLVVTPDGTDIFNLKLPGRGEYVFCRGTKGVVGAVAVPVVLLAGQKNHALL